MFDYQAGEKYKVTLFMTAIAGLLAGMFFTLLIMPSPEPAARRHKGGLGMSERVSNNPDITGRRSFGEPGGGDGAASASGAPARDRSSMVDRAQAQMFMQNWLPRIWDLSASTADANQETAIKWMTADCATAYRHNIWTAELAKQVQESGLRSSFAISDMNVSENLADGSVVVKVHGTQTLGVPGKKGRTRDVNLEYMLKQTADGMRIAGISEGKR